MINAGLRMDSFFHIGKTRSEPIWSVLPQNRLFPDAQAALFRQSQNPYPGDPTAFPVWDGRDMFRLWPRLGVSHPITDRSAIYFAYGRFFVLPLFHVMYKQNWVRPRFKTLHEDLNGDGRLSSYEYYGNAQWGRKTGSSDIRPGSTTNYEVGMNWNFVSDYTATATAFYRRAEDYPNQGPPSRWLDPATKTFVEAFWVQNANSPETRGLEVAMNKRFSDFFSFQASYTWYWKQNNYYRSGGAERWFPDSDFLEKGAYRYRFDIDQETGERIWKPLTGQEIRSLSAFADVQIQKEIDAYSGVPEETGPQVKELWISEKFKDQMPGAPVGLPITTQEKNITAQITDRGDILGPHGVRDSESDGSITLLLATPEGFGPDFQGLRPMGDLNINLVLRIQPGSYFMYEPDTPTPSTKSLVIKTRLLETYPTAFTTDLGIQKGFRVGRFRPMVFFEATNLFNGRKQRPMYRWIVFNDIANYGLAIFQPRPDVQRTSNTVWDPWQSYQNRAREIFFGVRMRL